MWPVVFRTGKRFTPRVLRGIGGGDRMDETAKRVLEESRRFRACLPELMKTYEGRWIVFRDGNVIDDFDDEDAAYAAAITRFGTRGGFVIAPVASDACDPVPVSAALVFVKPSP